MPFNLGFWEVLIIVVVALLLFGGRKIPQLARDLGTGIREFKNTLNSAQNEIDDIKDMSDSDAKTKKKA